MCLSALICHSVLIHESTSLSLATDNHSYILVGVWCSPGAPTTCHTTADGTVLNISNCKCTLHSTYKNWWAKSVIMWKLITIWFYEKSLNRCFVLFIAKSICLAHQLETCSDASMGPGIKLGSVSCHCFSVIFCLNHIEILMKLLENLIWHIEVKLKSCFSSAVLRQKAHVSLHQKPIHQSL